MEQRFPITLSQEFNDTLNLIERSTDHFFITGRAGTGKSTLLRLFRKTTRKRSVVLAPTGIAALNVKGQTIHSFFGFPPKLLDKREITKRRNHRMYKNLDVIIIDEVSMVRADMLDNIDRFLRINRNNDKPFGGVQMIYFGDLFQLPPVIASDFERQFLRANYESQYFFSAHVMNHIESFQIIELNKVFRQEERRFIQLLDSIRYRDMDYDDLEELNRRHQPDFKLEEYYIVLSSRNAQVDEINQRKIESLDTPAFQYTATITGTFNPRLFPTQSILNLKLGAQVMFIKNDPDKQFVNGTIGIIAELDHDKVVVSTKDEMEASKLIEVEPLEWEILKYGFNSDRPKEIESRVVGTFKQYPLKLAWAITIHKSQGKTFENVIIDLGRGAFEHGQTYVALSRCKTLEGIVLKKQIHPRDIMVDEKITDFYFNHGR